MAGVVRPMFGMLEDVEEVALRHADTDLVFKLRQPCGLLRRRQLLQVRCPVGIDAQLAVGREPGIDRGGHLRQFGFQRGGEILAPFGNTESGAVSRQPRLAFRPRQKLRAIVGEFFGPDDIDIASLQRVRQMTKTQTSSARRSKVPDPDRRLPTKPCHAGMQSRDRQHPTIHSVVRDGARADDRQGIKQTVILCCRLDVHEIERTERRLSSKQR